jgi:transcriptional regulator NrdR family protein
MKNTVVTCHRCGGESCVTDSRRAQFGVRRIRRCTRCGAKWRTQEIHARNVEMIAVNRVEATNV